MLTIIATAKLNDIAPRAWLSELLARIADMPRTRSAELLAWKLPVVTNHEQARREP